MNYEEKLKKVGKIELWIVSAIYAFSIMVLLTGDEDVSIVEYPGEPSIIPSTLPLVRELVQFTLIYLSFIFISLYIVPRLRRKESIVLNIIWVAGLIFLIGIVFGPIDLGIAPVTLFFVYAILKHGLVYLWDRSPDIRERFHFLAPGVLLVAVLWLIGFIFFILGEADGAAIAGWLTMIPFAVVLYSYSFFSFIPAALKQRRPFLAYAAKVVLLIMIASVPLALIAFSVTIDSEVAIVLTVFNAFFQVFVTMPFSWFFYKRYRKGADEIDTLQKELGLSAANVDFLRSQINPHFLFNAMNTLYGTAIHEKAERTAEGIQKLGDMMRFMLHENMQPRIPLSREIEYLRNYISLQRLRTDTIPGVTIDAQVDDKPTFEYISPMLLIPFVENAFKHGISFMEPSFIKITLEISGKQLDFNVTNTKHIKSNDDPEKDKSGIGLANVTQRLRLFYPDKHKLSIHESSREFFIHLTIQLS